MTTFSRRVLHLDLETYCDEDLGKCGVHKYAASPSCEILLLSYALDDGPVVTCDALESGFKKKYETFRRLFVDKDIVKAAHNAVFEMTILSRKGFVIRPDEWLCTMALANYAGLPPSLAALSNILHLFDKGKMTIGTQLINYFSKPCKPTKANGGRTRNLPKDDPERWAAFKEYNRRDVEAEREVYKRLIKFDQPEAERRVFLLDYEINRRGIGVDRRLAEQAVKMSEQITDAAVTELKRLTGLGNPNSVVQFKSWLAEKGVAVESLTKTAAETLRDSVEDPLIKRAVALKLSISKASVKKYDAMLRAYNASSEIEDFGTVNGAFQYYGANRTGRWAGRLVQLQNLRRNSLPNLDVARTLVRSGDYDDLRLAYDDYDTSEILGQLVRTAFIPTPGNKFIVADFSAIEARVIAWLAGERWRMEAFARGEDIYKSSYSQAFGVPIDQITKEMRQKGKIMELACGYGGSVGALKAFGADRLGLNDDELKHLVNRWRSASPNIVRFWRRVENACKGAIDEGRTTRFKPGLKIGYETGRLKITLPSGRSLYYQDARLEPGKFGPMITYMDVNQVSRHWDRADTHGGKLAENVTQAVARDCLAAAMLRLNDAGYKIVSHIHDEVVIDAPQGAKVSEVEKIVGESVLWAPGLLLTAHGYEGRYYFKD